MRLVARGMSNKAIAHQLGISPRTVEGHLNHVFDKLGVLSRTELVHYALASRLVRPGRPTSATRPPDPMTGAGDDPGDAAPVPTAATPTGDGPAVGPGRRPAAGAASRRPGRRGRTPGSGSSSWSSWRSPWSAWPSPWRSASTRRTSLLEVSTVVLFVVPVVVASLNYGLAGGLATVAWVAVAQRPPLVEARRTGATGRAVGRGAAARRARWCCAVLVGRRVSAETRLARPGRRRPRRPGCGPSSSTRTCSSRTGPPS